MLAIRNNPFSSMASVREEMDRVFGGFMAPRTLTSPAYFGRSEAAYAPVLNVWEDDTTIHFEAELPGFSQEDLDVSIDGDRLTIRGERSGEVNQEGKQFHRRERWSGRFSRTITLPTTLDTSKANASLVNGVLDVQFPKREEVRPRRITVKPA